MTVFLTTQYLEEADQLADHLGIIDHGKIVAEGTPDALKAEVGRPTVEVVPTDHAERDRAVELLRPLRRAGAGDPAGRRGQARRGRRRGARRHRPRLRPGGRQGREPRAARGEPQRRLPRQDRALARGRAARRPPRRARPASSPRSRERRRDGGGRTPDLGADPRAALDLDAGAGARPALDQAHHPPARGGHPGDDLPADPAGDQLRRAEVGDLAAGLPDRLLRHLRPRLRLHPGRRLRGDRDRPEPRRGQPGRLLQPPPADSDPPGRAGRRAARRHARRSASSRPRPTSRSGCSRAPTSRPASPAPW